MSKKYLLKEDVGYEDKILLVTSNIEKLLVFLSSGNCFTDKKISLILRINKKESVIAKGFTNIISEALKRKNFK